MTDKKDDDKLLANIKEHIHFEANMNDSMLASYIDYARRYVAKKVSHPQDYLVIMVVSIMNEHRVSSEDFKEALLALEPIFALEELTNNANE